MKKYAPDYSMLFLLNKILQHVTLEPMLLLKMFAESNARVIAWTLETERVCRVNLNHTAEECAAIDDGNHTHIQVSFKASRR